MQIGAPLILKLIALCLGLIAGLAAVVELGRTIGTERAAPETALNPIRAALAHCRDLLPEDYSADIDCRAAWVETRRRFLALPAKPAPTE